MNRKLKPGDIGFAMNHASWLSRQIAWFMGSRWSHSFLVHDPDEDETYLSETDDFQVRLSSLEFHYGAANHEWEIWSPKDMSKAERRRIVQICRKNLDQRYGYVQLISLGIRCLLKRWGWVIPNYIRHGIVCCHHVMYGYTESSLKGFTGVDPEGYDTEDLYQRVVRSGLFKKVDAKKRGQTYN